MKNKILFRLFRYFVLSLGAFAVVIGVIFSFLLSRHNTEFHIIELERRAAQISETLSVIIETGTSSGMGGGLESYLRFIENVAISDVWIVYSGSDEIIFGHRHFDRKELTLNELPYEAIQMVSGAFYGVSSVSESFSVLMESSVITAVAPIIGSDGGILGVALVHSCVANANGTLSYSIWILFISTLIAILFSVFMAFFLSLRFTNPLGKMKEAALLIYSGVYSAKTGITQSDEIGELASVLDDMAARLEESSQESAKLEKLRRDFVANISHELRTPITVIRSSSEAICDGLVADFDEVLAYNNQILNESIYLERLVSDLLDLARLQNPDFKMEMQNVDLKYIVEDVIRSMRRIAKQKGVQLNFTYSDEDFMTMGDYGRLRQMVMIILDNAIKFTPKEKKIEIAILKNSGLISIIVQDEGCGICSDDLPHIFERFYKQRSEKNKTGVGLGLAIAKQIADRHDITISVTSDEGKGTTFLFTFKPL